MMFDYKIMLFRPALFYNDSKSNVNKNSYALECEVHNRHHIRLLP